MSTSQIYATKITRGQKFQEFAQNKEQVHRATTGILIEQNGHMRARLKARALYFLDMFGIRQ